MTNADSLWKAELSNNNVATEIVTVWPWAYGEDRVAVARMNLLPSSFSKSNTSTMQIHRVAAEEEHGLPSRWMASDRRNRLSVHKPDSLLVKTWNHTGDWRRRGLPLPETLEMDNCRIAACMIVAKK
jgi:hypothetical protein